MKNAWTTWLLAGALVASLQWNLAPGGAPEGRDAPETPPPAGADSRCDLDPERLGLTGAKAAEFDEVCRTTCAEADRLQTRAEAELRELRRLLAAPDLDEDALRERVREVSTLRAQALEASVAAILRVRTIVEPGRMNDLLDACCPVEPCASDTACGVGGD